MDNTNTYYMSTSIFLQTHYDHLHQEEEEAASRTRLINTTTNNTVRYYKPQNPRKKKRSNLLRINNNTTNCFKKVAKDPKTTMTCTECGKKFWSEKALYGHMRCHPERPWRGINPPINLKRPILEPHLNEDHEIAECLLLLASGVPPTNNTCPNFELFDEGVGQKCVSVSGVLSNFCKFECSICKKVFGSHEELKIHRATHKNVYGECSSSSSMVFGGHECSICLRVFSSGQALGGHMRCHWEKVGDETTTTTLAESGVTRAVSVNVDQKEQGNIDLNIPPLTMSGDDQDDSSLSYSSVCGLDLNLRLGL